jgi:hypothetical protein
MEQGFSNLDDFAKADAGAWLALGNSSRYVGDA